MGEILKQAVKTSKWFHIFSFVAVGLIITSFILPPSGEIHPSILAAVGELFAFAALGALNRAIDKGLDAKVKHNNTEVTVGNLND